MSVYFYARIHEIIIIIDRTIELNFESAHYMMNARVRGGEIEFTQCA